MPSTQHGSSRTTAASTSSAAEEGPSVSSPVHMECDDAAAESQQAPASTEQSADIGDGAAVVGSSAMDDFLAEAANAGTTAAFISDSSRECYIDVDVC